MLDYTNLSNIQGNNSVNLQVAGDLNVEAEDVNKVIDFINVLQQSKTIPPQNTSPKHLSAEDILLRDAYFLEDYFDSHLINILSVCLDLILPPVTRYTPIYMEHYFVPLSNLCNDLFLTPLDVECLVKHGCMEQRIGSYFPSVDEILQNLSIVFNRAFDLEDFNKEFIEYDEIFRKNGCIMGAKEINRFIHKSTVYPDKYQLLLKNQSEIINLPYTDEIKNKMCKFLGKIPTSEIHKFMIEKIPHSENLYRVWNKLKKYKLTILGIFVAKRSLESLLGTQIQVNGTKEFRNE